MWFCSIDNVGRAECLGEDCARSSLLCRCAFVWGFFCFENLFSAISFLLLVKKTACVNVKRAGAPTYLEVWSNDRSKTRVAAVNDALAAEEFYEQNCIDRPRFVQI